MLLLALALLLLRPQHPLALQNLCGGDAKLAQLLHNKLREEITRCSSRART